MNARGQLISFRQLLGVLLLCLPAGWAFGQSYPLPLERRITDAIELHLSATDTTVQTALKPFHAHQFNRDSVPQINGRDKRYFSDIAASMTGRHMFEVHEDDFTFMVDVVLDLELGFEFADSIQFNENRRYRYNNTRGVAAWGTIGNRVSFHATVFETQSELPYWVQAYSDSLGVIPGQGRFKQGTSLYTRDFNAATGLVSIEAADWLHVHLGHGRHFVGHGYRSMLLSDVAFNYPYLRLHATSRNNKWSYATTIAELNSLDRLPLGDVPESLFQRKGFAFHYLGWMPHPRVELGLYEAVIFQRWDSTGTKAYPATFYQPLPLVSSAAHGLNGVQNALLGLNAKVKITNNLFVYGQFIADQFSSQFTGLQAGFFSANTGIKNLTIRGEYNQGGQGLYAHDIPLQSYTHMNQGMAHPLGTNFKEGVVILRHELQRFWSEWRGVYQLHSGGNRGNVFATPAEIDAAIDQSGPTLFSDLKIGFMLNPVTNSHFIMGWTWRERNAPGDRLLTSYLYFAARVGLFNRYYDI